MRLQGEEENNYVFKMSSAPLRKASPPLPLRGCGRCCLEIAQIAPHRVLTQLSADCSVWLQTESGHARDFVSSCQAMLKKIKKQRPAELRNHLCLESTVSLIDPGFKQVIRLSYSHHNKYQTHYPEWYSVPEHLIHPFFTGVSHVIDCGVLKMSYRSLVKCHHPAHRPVRRAMFCPSVRV